MNDSPIDWLFSLAQFGIKFGLENIRAIVAALGHPERQFESVHVAGTNGKGSVTAMVEAALRRPAGSPAGMTGYRTGRYTSPHLVSLTERIAIDGAPVAEPDLLDAVETVRRSVERLRREGVLDVHPTFFEVTTAAAFELFRRHKVDVAVCETGLGGRLDATNVLLPMACAITSIAFDHQQYLGTTLADIAREKAGIVKPGVPVVVGPLPDEAVRPIADRAAACGASLVWAMDGCDVGAARPSAGGAQTFSLRTPVRDYGCLTLALPGGHQVINAVVAVRLLECLEGAGLAVGPDAVARGLASVQWPGRLQQLRLPEGREALLDAAHNEEGARALAAYLQTLGPPRPLVFAAMRDKDVAAMLRILAPHVSALYLTRASNPRSADPADLAAAARRFASIPLHATTSLTEALQQAFDASPRIVVAGSIFLLGDVMKELRTS